MENINRKIEEAKARAFDLYVKDQFVCSGGSSLYHTQNPDAPLSVELIRLALEEKNRTGTES